MPYATDHVLCMRCRLETRHVVRAQHEENHHTSDAAWHFRYQVLQCAGCDSITYRTVTGGSEFWNPHTEEENHAIDLYPPRHVSSRAPKEFSRLPPSVDRIYAEVLSTYNAQIPILCAGGIRAILEGICADKKVTGGEVPKQPGGDPLQTRTSTTLEGKIAGLAQQGILHGEHAAILHSLRFLGNEALHELAAPTIISLDAAIDVIEHTLEHVYELAAKASRAHRPKS